MNLLLVLLVEAVSVDIDEVGLHVVSIRACHHGEVVQGALTRLPQVPQVRARMLPPGRLNLVARNAQAGFYISRETSFSGIKLGAEINQNW